MHPPARTRSIVRSLIPAVLAFASLTAKGQAPTFDEHTPIDTLREYSSRGNGAAMVELGERILQGKGVAADPEKGLTLLQNSAESGYSQAWYELGVVYANAIGVKTDMPKAIGFFRKGASFGNADCQCSMGMMYQAGDRIPGGIKADPSEARKWYGLAAEQGHQEAILHLGQLLMSGQGGPPDPLLGAQWFRKGAENGNFEAQWSLGQCYLLGKGVAMDSVQAYALFAAAVSGADNPEQKKGMGERKDMLGKTLSQKQRDDGDRLAGEWKARRR